MTRKPQPERRTSRPSSQRRGVYTLELVLILPIVLLVAFLFYQLSVMLLTRHALQSTAQLASRVASEKSMEEMTPDYIVEEVNRVTQGWFFQIPHDAQLCDTLDEWNNPNTPFKVRILQDSRGDLDGADLNDVATPTNSHTWSFVEKDTPLSSRTLTVVEIRLSKLSSNYPQYWVASSFKGVSVPTPDSTDDSADSFTVSAVVFRP
ncbi:MAG: TadE/TadG family type IV pilus assembly protein [Planctomycetia bacterium]|nr:TadE/TadG family type IV pilus assembly protein [Planctomycetia bacterium]